MTFIRHLLFAVTLVFAGAAFALDLDSAKSQGLVGEQLPGRGQGHFGSGGAGLRRERKTP